MSTDPTNNGNTATTGQNGMNEHVDYKLKEPSANKDLKLQLKNLESISEKKQKQKKHKIKISKNQKSSLQYNNQILLTNPDELSKSYE
jgi:hypothetical protein